MTPEEKNLPENTEMLNAYNDAYRNNYLVHFKNEIKTSLLARKIFHRIPDFVSIKNNLENIKNIHANPEKHLERESPIAFPPQPESKFKKYLVRASVVLGLFLLTAMTFKFLPLTAVGMTIVNVAMYAASGIGLIGHAEKKYAEYQYKKRVEKREKSLGLFNLEMRNVTSFFANRRATTNNVFLQNVPQESIGFNRL
jgi:hypothetical protein